MKHESILISLQRSRRQKLCNALHFVSIVLFHFILFLLHGIVWDAHTWFYECFLCFKSEAFVFITFVSFPFAVVSIILARKHTFQKVWSSIHSRTYVPQPFQEYSMLDLQNQQKGKFIKVQYHHFPPQSHSSLISFSHFPSYLTFQIVSLTELMAGVKAPSKTCQLFQLMCWPSGHKVPTSTNSLVELMNMVERWRQKTDYGPVVVVSA